MALGQAPVVRARARKLGARSPELNETHATDVGSARTSVRALVFANPVAPNVELDRLRAALDAQVGAGSYRVIETASGPEFAAEAERQLTEAASDGCKLVLAAGGDGTISMIAELLYRLGSPVANMVLGIVPCGTANILAKELEIPSTIEEAVALAVESPRVVPIDGIAIGDRLCLTQVGIGLDAYMIRDTTREAQLRFKRLSYLATLARRTFGHRSQAFRIRIDGRPFRIRAWQVLLANASTLGTRPFVWGPDIDPTDGVADLCIFQVQHLRDLLSLIWTTLTGRLETNPNAQFLRARKEVQVESSRPLPVQGDGESLGFTPVRLKIATAAVQVAVPAPKEEAANGSSIVAPSAPGAEPTRPSIARMLRSFWLRARASLGVADTATFLAINRLNGGPHVDRLLAFASRVLDWGEIWALIVLAVALYDRRLTYLPIVVLPPLWITMLTLNGPVKLAFLRQRPFLLHEHARLIGRTPLDSSFPSGHTAAAFAGATLLSPHLPAFAPAFWAYAIMVGFSRVYLGAHFPADVLVGALVGAGLATLYGGLWSLVISWFAR
jgi:diacylglycerol kinase (ATP)